MKPGPKPALEDKGLLSKIKQCILEGNNLEKTAELCDVPITTFYTWHSDNYLKIADKIEGWKRDRKLMLANKNIEDILQLGINDKDTVKVVSDMSKFVAETLGKANYSKRNELTGKNGKDLGLSSLLDSADGEQN